MCHLTFYKFRENDLLYTIKEEHRQLDNSSKTTCDQIAYDYSPFISDCFNSGGYIKLASGQAGQNQLIDIWSPQICSLQPRANAFLLPLLIYYVVLVYFNKRERHENLVSSSQDLSQLPCSLPCFPYILILSNIGYEMHLLHNIMLTTLKINQLLARSCMSLLLCVQHCTQPESLP